MLQPPSREIEELISEMSCNQSLCDEYTNDFGYPERQWTRFRSPESIRAWIESYRKAG